MKLICNDPKPKILRPVLANAGLEVMYRHKLDQLIARMHKSICYWLTATYRARPPEMASDASPASGFIASMRGLGRRWQARFNQGAEALGKYFAQAVGARVDGALKAILKDAGWSVKFRMTKPMNDVMQATVGGQVNLIKSIASEHLTDVQGLVLRSVQEGRDLATLTQGLERQYNLTRRRAALIAKDQNNKATATLTRVRQTELGIKQAVWLHSAGGKEPRPKHVAFAAGKLGGPIYDIDQGAPIADRPGEYTWPGVEINCRCVSRSIIPGLS